MLAVVHQCYQAGAHTVCYAEPGAWWEVLIGPSILVISFSLAVLAMMRGDN